MACGDATVMLDFVEEALDQIALLVDVLVIRDGLRARSGRRNDRLGTRLCDAQAKPIGVIAPVGQQMFERQAADEILGLEDIVHLAAGQDEADGIAKRIHTGADLGAQAAARTPDRLIFAPPFAPAACWWARTMVESMIRYSKSGLCKRGKSSGIGMIIRFPRRRESDSLRACRRPTILMACRTPN